MLRRQTPSDSSFSRSQAKTLGVAVLASALLLPAFASSASATATCPTGSISVGNGICEVAFTTPGETTWTVPANVTSIEALLVGAGGASDGEYAGGGGDVIIVELTGPGEVTVVVGEGAVGEDGLSSSVVQDGSTSEAAGGSAGGYSLDGPGQSGNGNLPSFRNGGGAGGAASDESGGPGVIVSELESTLFGSVSECLGGGGGGFVSGLSEPNATCGGGYLLGFDSSEGLGTSVPPIANSGGGAGASVTFSEGNYDYEPTGGAHGKVVIRFTLSDQLAKTGGSALPWMLGGAVAVGTIGATMAAIARRKRA